MACRLGAAHRPRLHAPVDGRGPRRGARARDDRGRRRGGHHRLRHRAGVRARRGELGHNERLLARALRRAGAEASARIVTKGGMTRTGGAWIPDGRAKAIRADCEASLAALDGLPIDLYLIHAPDPRTPWRTSVRALARLVDDGLVQRVGLSNVNRRQLDEALELAPIAAVQVALSPFDDRAAPRRSRRALRGDGDRPDRPLAARRAAPGGRPRSARRRWPRSPTRAARRRPRSRSPGCSALAAGRGRDPRRPAAGDRALRRARREARARRRRPRRPRARVRRASPGSPDAAAPSDDADVVLVMGIPGAGKSRVAEEYVARGYVRLNRDERGGSLRELAEALDETLSSGVRRVVLDNTYLTRAARSYVIEAASRHGVADAVRLARHAARPGAGQPRRAAARALRLAPDPEELPGLARREQGVLAPTSQMRALRELEPPSIDEGFAEVERVPFVRTPPSGTRAGVFVAAAALRQPGWEEAIASGDPRRASPRLRLEPRRTTSTRSRPTPPAWRPMVSGRSRRALCPHPAGPPTCWCRPPLPGLPLAFARAHGVDPARSIVIGTGPAHRTLATTLGARYRHSLSVRPTRRCSGSGGRGCRGRTSA